MDSGAVGEDGADSKPSFDHDPGCVVRDLVVSIADGGDCLADLGVLREQPDLFGEVASVPTGWWLSAWAS